MKKRKKQKSNIIKYLLIMSIMAIGLNKVNNIRKSSDSYIRDRVVRLAGNGYSCTGVMVKGDSGKSYILTADHCNVLLDAKDHSIDAIDEQGDRHTVFMVEEDSTSDLMLLTSFSGKSIDIAKHTKRHQKVHAMTHGRGHDSYRTDGELLEFRQVQIPIFPITDEASFDMCKAQVKYGIALTLDGFMCMLDVVEQFSTTMIAPGSSGGPLVNDKGELIGIASASDGIFSLWAPLSDIQSFMSDK